ncbi:uracil-DNA glycosylase [uncultured Megasphaera sp.]|uniref:uracil-DNA glycosylase n=1 Tax=uncultured Megasphaera sp. TaxID=165188 RepID=UPI00259958F3|nr:uracil-DNA glycosylase [uncultured Megasphaera sp.]
MTLTAWLDRLQQYTGDRTFNPWRMYDPRCDIGPEAPRIRREQLASYLESRLPRASYLLIAEAAGYQGCRFSGIALTCERMLLGAHPRVRPEMILPRPGRRTSLPTSAFLTNDAQRRAGLNEPTDTYVWGAIADSGLPPYEVILWNMFPFHPYGDTPFSNRTPTGAELRAGLQFTEALLTLFPSPPVIAAIGKKAAAALATAGIPARSLRHPANGGGAVFRRQFARRLQEERDGHL